MTAATQRPTTITATLYINEEEKPSEHEKLVRVCLFNYRFNVGNIQTRDNKLTFDYVNPDNPDEYDCYIVEHEVTFVNGMLTWTVDVGIKLQQFTLAFRT